MSPTTSTPTRTETGQHVHDVVVVGTGFAGIGTAIQLRERGIDDVVLLERGDAVGGTWRDNHYPGAACDVPSHLYSLSFEPKPDWSSSYARQDEIREYLEGCVAKHDLRRLIRFGVEVTRADWDEATATWTLSTDDGRSWRARTMVMGIGFLRDPALARVPGLDDFAGPQMHSASWDHDVDLTGKRVGVIGTGASAIQFVPEIAPVAGHTTVFQRTAPWVIPKLDREYSTLEKLLFRFVPGLRAAKRASIYANMESTYFLFFQRKRPLTDVAEQVVTRVIRRQMADEEKIAKVIPDITLGCKRVLKSNDWYPTLDRADVTVETTGIDRVVADGVVLADGTKVELDVLVHGTGFAVENPLGVLDVTGRDGRDLRRTWGDRPTAYLGIEVPGFPNAFILHGPNTGLGHNSMVFMLESGMTFALQAIERIVRGGARTIEVREEAHDAYVAEVDERNEGTIWASGCQSWYLNEAGENYSLWPGSTIEYRRRTATFDEAAHHVEHDADQAPRETEPALAG